MQVEKYLPNRKITAAGVGIPISVVIAWLLTTFVQVEMPNEVSMALGGIISTLLGYLVPEKE